MTPAAVLFDCDGVIVDSEGIALDLAAADLTAHGLPITPEGIADNFLGGTIAGLRDRANALGATLPPAWVDDFYERLYARLAEGVPMFPGVEAVFDRLDAARIPYAVGSNGTLRKMEITLGQHPELFARLRGRLFSGQDLHMVKPAPDLYLHAAAALGTDPACCTVIEDSPTGARAARAAGMRCMGFAPHGDGARLAAEGAAIFRDMADLPGLLGL